MPLSSSPLAVESAISRSSSVLVRTNSTFLYHYHDAPEKMRGASSPRCGALETVVDRFAQARPWNRHYRNGCRAAGIKRAQMRKQCRRRLGQVANGREIQRQDGSVGICDLVGAEGQ